MGPDLGDQLETLAVDGVRDVVCVPVGFVSEHVEILFDVDIRARRVAEGLGMRFERPPALDDDPVLRGRARGNRPRARCALARLRPRGMTTLSWDQVLAFRLERQFLDSRAPAGSMFEVTRALCGVRAQLPSTAELGLWARVEGLEQGDVKSALEHERALVKTWTRGQLYLLPADDLAVHVAALYPRPEGPGDAWLRLRRVTREQYDAIIENVPRALDGRPRTREWLADRLAELAGPDVREAVLFSWGGVLKQSARRGDLCFGPPRGRNITFVRPDRWLRQDPARGSRRGWPRSPPTLLRRLRPGDRRGLRALAREPDEGEGSRARERGRARRGRGRRASRNGARR